MEGTTKYTEIGVDNIKWIIPLIYFWSLIDETENVPKPLILGPPGIGKTAIIKKVSKALAKNLKLAFLDATDIKEEKLEEILSNTENTFVFLDWKAAQRSIDDLYGKLVGKDGGWSVNYPPADLFSMIVTKYGVLFLDEITLVQSPQLRSALLKMVNEGQIGSYKTKALVIGAGNTRNHTPDAVDLPGPLLNRFIIIYTRGANRKEYSMLMKEEEDTSKKNFERFLNGENPMGNGGLDIRTTNISKDITYLFYFISKARKNGNIKDSIFSLKGFAEAIFPEHLIVKLWREYDSEIEITRRGYSNFQTHRTLRYLGRILSMLGIFGYIIKTKIWEDFKRNPNSIPVESLKDILKDAWEKGTTDISYVTEFLRYVKEKVGVTDSEKNLLRAIVYGLIGPKKGGEFMTFIEFEFPETEKLLDNPKIIREYLERLEKKFEKVPYRIYLNYLSFKISVHIENKLKEMEGSYRGFIVKTIEKIFKIGDEIASYERDKNLEENLRDTFLYPIIRNTCYLLGSGKNKLESGYLTIHNYLLKGRKEELAKEIAELMKASKR